MKLNPCCMNCQLRKQEAKIRHFDDEDRKKQYMEAIRRRFDRTEKILLLLLGRPYGGFFPDQQRI